MMFGGEGITMGDYSGISASVKVYTGTEDLSGEWLVQPCVPAKYRKPIVGPIRFGNHCSIGANSLILPGADFPDGACTGAFTLIKKPLRPWSIYAGIPARFIRERSKKALLLQAEMEHGDH